MIYDIYYYWWGRDILPSKGEKKMKVTYEIENGKKVKVKTYADGTVKKYDKNGNKIYFRNSKGYEEWYYEE